jgi:hypothetical protein
MRSRRSGSLWDAERRRHGEAPDERDDEAEPGR